MKVKCEFVKKTETICLIKRERPVARRARALEGERQRGGCHGNGQPKARLVVVLISFVNKKHQPDAEETNLHGNVITLNSVVAL